MDNEEDKRPKKPDITIGEDLAMLSVEELRRRIAVLNAEVERLKEAIAKKEKSRETANSVFKL